MNRIAFIVLLAISLAASVSRAQDLDVASGAEWQRTATEHGVSLDREGQPKCGNMVRFVPAKDHELGMGIWRDSRTGDVLIRGNLRDDQHQGNEDDASICPDVGKDQKRLDGRRKNRW